MHKHPKIVCIDTHYAVNGRTVSTVLFTHDFILVNSVKIVVFKCLWAYSAKVLTSFNL